MAETVYRLKLTTIGLGLKPIFILVTSSTYNDLLEQARAEGTFKLTIVKTFFNKTGNLTAVTRIQKYIHPGWPFLSQKEEDKAFEKCYKKFETLEYSTTSEYNTDQKANQDFLETYKYQFSTRDYSLIKLNK